MVNEFVPKVNEFVPKVNEKKNVLDQDIRLMDKVTESVDNNFDTIGPKELFMEIGRFYSN